MKKKLFEKDIFYLSLFICICVVAIGGILFTNKNLNKLASDKSIKKDNEINLIKDDKDTVATSTESKENLQKAKEREESKKPTSKINYIGTKVIRGYSETVPSYSKTLDVWEIHKGLDISSEKGYNVKSILDGEVESVYSDDMYGKSVKMSYGKDLEVTFSGLNEDVPVKKGDKVKEGQCIGYVANTTKIESEDGTHVHIEAYKNNEAINPLGLLE